MQIQSFLAGVPYIVIGFRYIGFNDSVLKVVTLKRRRYCLLVRYVEHYVLFVPVKMYGFVVLCSGTMQADLSAQKD